MEQEEIFRTVNAHTADDPIFNMLLATGLPQNAIGRRLIPGSRWRGTQDRFELVIARFDA